MRKGLLVGPEGEASEIDTKKIGHQEWKNLLERLVKVADENNEKFLLKLKNRIETVGIDLPTIEVRYEHLNIEANAYVGSRALPSFINFMTNFVEVTGNVTYNGHELHEFVPKTSVYICQHDLHIGEMTVRETLEFSARCQGICPRYG
ncbi:hypothetical protein RND71_008186 [Anisodus tanguticus]|uniref:Pleiotropic ABC efflux transporter N-terminal domain-containing protein n=1 Tax=Anisodus tanguticus TaxID=243964 RepID=A0AAE1VKS8_9SOLA|nr:hypothetical protein RND71_008186 [Anisodus tanguticus]